MALRKAALLFALVIPIACQEAGQVPLTGPSPSLPLTMIGTMEVPKLVADAGCTIGRSVANGTSRTITLSRNKLPFALPLLDRVPATIGRVASFRIARFAVPRTDALRPLTVACIVPLKANTAELRATILRTPDAGWREAERLLVPERSSTFGSSGNSVGRVAFR